jgi:hypothetical protein
LNPIPQAGQMVNEQTISHNVPPNAPTETAAKKQVFLVLLSAMAEKT